VKGKLWAAVAGLVLLVATFVTRQLRNSPALQGREFD
jgi:hypothetical protein